MCSDLLSLAAFCLCLSPALAFLSPSMLSPPHYAPFIPHCESSPSRGHHAVSFSLLGSRAENEDLAEPSPSLPISRRTTLSDRIVRPSLNVLALGVSSSLPLSATPKEAAAVRPVGPGATVEDALAQIMQCKPVLLYVREFVDKGLWDRARSNVNWCSRRYAIYRNMMKVSEEAEGVDSIEGIEIAAAENLALTFLDSTAYQPIFAFDTASGNIETMRKYQATCYRYLDESLELLDKFLALIPASLKDVAGPLGEAEYPVPEFCNPGYSPKPRIARGKKKAKAAEGEGGPM
uniref:Uncharacterized protein n=1 Tax=Chromera velia CCMP2878 TaxID=1169474 RepID=A0A0G4FCF0_9ALVE|mmetsp:Transcript_7982/g.15560  ORF Transcript_7982/g.15560 Transcript_7982/m.15560 type:complete len:291 (-) Transcript_7982:378-1250(-)|eukprot:Cvel_16349.t1-p1 / transcript=Cvel_16349.t1 / gene=Cvel_16349 / organism=Chromera_velia_CCMP2878 / gene_product=hypothetical protein / transcript_product=hypothetical protein / location=Cvel_scaffold1255:20839-23056(-) / protein_length=290 / sequence_SO=supercontig / SO=protein_coding / is_pseudo=false